MYPVIFTIDIPAWLKSLLGPGTMLAKNWNWLIGLLVVTGVLAVWASGSTAGKGRRIAAIGSGVLAVVFGLLVGGVALARLKTASVHTYGVMIVVGFVVGIVLALRETRRVGEDQERLLDLAFWLLVAALLGSRLLYIAENWAIYAKQPQLIWKIWQGGLVFYGGFIGALLASWIYMKRFGGNFMRLADVVIPSVAIGHFFGRLGCFAMGCCYGKTSTSAWAVTFPAKHAVGGIGLHPTQLYEALAELSIFFLLLFVRSVKRYHGQVLFTYLLAYPAVRLFVEYFRADTRGYLLHGRIGGMEILSVSQLISIVLVLIAIVGMFHFGKKAADARENVS